MVVIQSDIDHHTFNQTPLQVACAQSAVRAHRSATRRALSARKSSCCRRATTAISFPIMRSSTAPPPPRSHLSNAVLHWHRELTGLLAASSLLMPRTPPADSV